MENQDKRNRQDSISSIASLDWQEFDDLDFSSGDELDQSIHQINLSHQFSNKLRWDKGNVRLEDKQMFSQQDEGNQSNSLTFESFSACNQRSKCGNANDFSDLWNDQLEFDHISRGQSENVFSAEGAYNRFIFVCQKSSEDPLVTIVEESWESEINF